MLAYAKSKMLNVCITNFIDVRDPWKESSSKSGLALEF